MYKYTPMAFANLLYLGKGNASPPCIYYAGVLVSDPSMAMYMGWLFTVLTN